LGRTDKFDAVVIGSGFGGSVAAWRLKQDCPDASILVLERGMPYPPRSFPRTPRELRANFWDPSSALYGLFEVWRFEHLKAVVSSGLGGGSLIYANVMLEKPPNTFAADAPNRRRAWPIGHEQLASRYPQIKALLDPKPLPDVYRTAGPAGTTSVPKTDQFIAAARAAGLSDARPAQLAVAFAAPHGDPEPGAPLGAENLHKRARRTCTLVGECDLGCNEGAKNSLDYTYLSEFKQGGGEIRTCAQAVGITPLARGEPGYTVRYLQHLHARARVEARGAADGKLDSDRELLDPCTDAVREVTATIVVLAAGTFGSTRLLAQNRAVLAPLSDQLGRGFSSNGDLLTVARDCSSPGRSQRELAPSRGPVITAYASGEGLWMEDAGGPLLSEWAWQLPELAGDMWAMRRDLPALMSGKARGSIGAKLARMLGSARSSSAMLPMLTMGRDVPGGRIRLDGDSLALDWDPDGASQGYFTHARRTASDVARELGGRLGPRWLLRHGPGITVHPLGGCSLGSDPDEGVVTPTGEVFGCPGLYVADGSVMPGPVGPNPSLTIAAIADVIAAAAARALNGTSA
jgi:cholesterol oxidase